MTPYKYDYSHGVSVSWRNRFIFVGGLIIVAVLIFFVVLRHNRSPLPNSVRKQVSFVVFYPDSSWKVATNKITYQQNSGVLLMAATKISNTLTITEQASPSQFTDIPQYYPALLDKLNEYQSFGTINGTIYLTRPTELKGATEALLNSNGTFVLVYPKEKMTETAWRQFFNNLRSLK